MAFGKQSTITISRKTSEIGELLQPERSFVEPLRAFIENDLMTENSGTKYTKKLMFNLCSKYSTYLIAHRNGFCFNPSWMDLVFSKLSPSP